MPQGFRCTFEVKVETRNIGALMYNNNPFGVFYNDKESGKWMMRPPAWLLFSNAIGEELPNNRYSATLKSDLA
jgi:hypothetical protein